MAAFGEYEAALKARDVLTELVMGIIEKERPKPRYGEVVALDEVQNVLFVQYPEGGDPIPVGMDSLTPLAVGQLVRVEGPRGDKYVSGIYGGVNIIGSTTAVPEQVVFSQIGAVALATSNRFYPTLDAVQIKATISVTTTGTSTTTVTFLKNGSSIGTVSLVAADSYQQDTLVSPFVADTDYLTVQVTLSGAGAVGLTVQVNFEQS